jgi:hypothetical protein
LLAGGVVLLGSLPAAAQQITVYRCVDADGRVALQDQPCPPGREAARRTVAAEADSAPLPPPPPVAGESPPASSPPMPVDAPMPTPPPELWRCVDFEGKQRFTAQPEPNGRYVPLWVVQGNEAGPRGLAGRAGRPAPRAGGSGPGGPGAATVPGALGPMVYVEDQCFLLPPEQACRRYRDQRAEIERKRPSRSGEERRQMEAESARLLGILRDACP